MSVVSVVTLGYPRTGAGPGLTEPSRGRARTGPPHLDERRPPSLRLRPSPPLHRDVAHVDDVAVGVLEPDALHPAEYVDVPLARRVGKVVVALECDALVPQVLHDRVEVVADAPGRRGRLVRARVRRLVDQHGRAP